MPVVLVVDDDPATRIATCKFLEAHQYIVICADNGWEALLALDRESAVDLMLVDIFMPGMDGTTFLRIIQNDSRRQNIPVIVTTGFDHSEIVITTPHLLQKGDPQYYDKMLKKISAVLNGKA